MSVYKALNSYEIGERKTTKDMAKSIMKTVRKEISMIQTVPSKGLRGFDKDSLGILVYYMPNNT